MGHNIHQSSERVTNEKRVAKVHVCQEPVPPAQWPTSPAKVNRSGGSLVNSGSWAFEDHYLGRGWGGPYWPGAAVELEDDGVPRPVRLLDDVPAERLSPGD